MLPRKNWIWLALLLIAATAAPAESIQTIPASQCVWHAGDNPAWSAPNLNEAGWKPLSTWTVAENQPWMWMRCHADLATLRQAIHPALQVNGARAYQVYLDGKQLGQNGNLHSGDSSIDPIRIFPLSAADATALQTIALRLKVRATGDALGNPGPPQLATGEAEWLRDQHDKEALQGAVSFLPVIVCFLVIGVMGFVLLGLYLNDRSHLELLLLALTCACLAILRLGDFFQAAMVPMTARTWWTLYAVGQALMVPQVWFMFRLAHRRVPLAYKIVLTISLFFVASCLVNGLFPARASLWGGAFYSRYGWLLLADGGLLVFAPFVAFWPWQRIAKALRPLAACAMLWGLMDLLWFSAEVWQILSPAGNDFFNQWRTEMLEMRAFATMAAIIALIGLLFRQQRRTAAERALLAGEMQAAREIQRMLAPECVETAQGARVEVAFRPMREVGGDFYLCRALSDGRQRVLVGDVSGKGAAAAMTATLLVGAAERRDENSPAELLHHLNLVLHTSQVGGFATCLCADLAPDGTVTLANAGHPAPYWRGEEVAMPPNLPLGLSATEAPCEEQRLQLAEGDTLTFVSDGVVEARDAQGQLFGFERTRAISNDSAEQIAAAAEHYGQEDDITVLTLTRAAVLVGS